MAIKPLEIVISAKDSASGVLDKLRDNAGKVAAAIAAYFGFEFFKGAVTGAAALEAKLSEVQAVSGATAGQLGLLRAAAEEAGATTKFSATEAAGALGELSRSGLDAQQAIAALSPTLALASAGGIDLGASASLVTKILAGFGFEAAEAGRIADVLAKGANASNTSVQGLGEALSYAAPTAVSMGMSLESVVAIIGKFADAGIDAGRAGTALNSILAQFSDPASKFRNELAAAGITTTDFETALRQLEAAGPAGQKAIAAVGLEAGPALKALLNQGIGSLDELKAKLLESAGAAKATADTMGNNLTGALGGLASAWDTVKNALATPVLPVLRDGVDQLTAALRSAVQDGTVGRFGAAIADGFQSALTWARAFLAEVDFAALSARVSDAADRAGAAFDTIATYAKNAGNTVALVWGVMSAGANSVLAVVYTVAEAFALVARDVMTGIALLREGLAKISFGSLSAGFAEAARDARESAGAFGAAADALSVKASQSAQNVADGAQTARDAWAGLTDAGTQAATQADTSARAFDQVADTLKTVGEQADTAAAKQEDSAQKQKQAVEGLRAEIKLLKTEYDEAVSAGDAQGAVEALERIRKKTEELNTELKKTKPDLDLLTGALKSLGITSDKELKDAAEATRKLYEQVKAAGGSTRELAEAFKRMAVDAVAANGGVASETLKAEAAALGLEIQVDATGKAIVRAMGSGKDAIDTMSDGITQATQNLKVYTDWLDKLEKRNAQVKSVLLTDKDGFAIDSEGKRITQAVDNRASAASKLQAMGVDEARAKQLAATVFDDRGNYTPKSSGFFRSSNDTADAVLQRMADAEKTRAPAVGTPATSTSHTVHIQLNNATPTTINTASAQDASALSAVLASLQDAASRAR